VPLKNKALANLYSVRIRGFFITCRNGM